MSSSSNDKNSVNFDFDLDSILSEFGALDEEPVSEKPFFEPSVPVMDKSKKSDQVFSAVVNDGFEASAPQDGFDFDATQIIEEFEAEDDGAESTSKLDPERIRREFESDARLLRQTRQIPSLPSLSAPQCRIVARSLTRLTA